MTFAENKNSSYQFMLGNHAIVEGAIAAGCRYFAGGRTGIYLLSYWCLLGRCKIHDCYSERRIRLYAGGN
jgi:hypothetical protein